MSCKCGKNNCNCSSRSGKEYAKLQNDLNEVRSQLDEVLEAVKPFLTGHPILMVEDPTDVSLFSFDTGLGSEKWQGWAICNGAIQTSPATGKDYQTPNMIDRFVVGAGDKYDVGDTGGEDSVELIINELPAHNHNVVDPGHSHNIQDPGHDHAATSVPHSHDITGVPHTHIINNNGNHSHNFTTVTAYSYSTGANGPSLGQLDLGTNNNFETNGAGLHNHTANETTAHSDCSDQTVGVTVNNAFVGITETDSAESGINLDDTGQGAAHENRPPYYAVLYIVKL